LILIVGVSVSGSRVDVDTTIHPVTLPADLDQYLKEREAAFKDIVPGTEKTIFWAGQRGVKTPLSVVYLHGFSASRQETAPLSEQVAKDLGANLFYTRFTGHGRGSEAMLDGSVNAWLNDANEALEIGRRLGEKVVVIGVSTGATAALWLGTQDTAEDVAAFVLISPNFGPRDWRSRLLLWPHGGRIAELVLGHEYSFDPWNELHRRYWTDHHPTRALLPMMGMVKLAKSLKLADMTTATLVIFSPDDQVVNVRATEKAVARIGSARKWLISYPDAADRDQHVLAGDILSCESTEKLKRVIVEFLDVTL
jgi:esterase/lipase